MSEDARFEDASEDPMRLVAFDADDLGVMAALVQDAVLPATEMTWRASEKRFALLLNRFRWEDKVAAEIGKRPYERVQSVLAFNDVSAVASQGIQRKDTETVLSLLSVSFIPTETPGGHIDLVFAGDGAVRLTVDDVDASLTDVTRPYAAPSQEVPAHRE